MRRVLTVLFATIAGLDQNKSAFEDTIRLGLLTDSGEPDLRYSAVS